MFGKLVKHEWLASRKLIGLLCLVVFLSGVLSGGILRYMVWSSVVGNGFMVTVYGVIMTVAVLAIVGGCVGAMYFLVYRFFKSRFEDEGYLTFTLPVTTHQQLLASMTNTVLGTVLVGLTACVSVVLAGSIFLTIYDAGTRQEMMDVISQGMQQAGNTLGLSGGMLLLEGLLQILVFLADMLLLMLACTTAMLLAKKHPILLGIGAYIGADLMLSGLSEAVIHVLGRTGAGLGISCGLYFLAAVGAYLLMHRLMEKHLNLH